MMIVTFCKQLFLLVHGERSGRHRWTQRGSIGELGIYPGSSIQLNVTSDESMGQPIGFRIIVNETKLILR